MIRSLMMVLLLAGCASAPVQEMSDARQTLQAAEAKTEREDGEDLRAARALLDRAERALTHRDFDTARSMAVQARAKALSVLEDPDDEKFE